MLCRYDGTARGVEIQHWRIGESTIGWNECLAPETPAAEVASAVVGSRTCLPNAGYNQDIRDILNTIHGHARSKYSQRPLLKNTVHRS